MDEYLDEEVEHVKQCFEMTCHAWDKQVAYPCCCVDLSNQAILAAI